MLDGITAPTMARRTDLLGFSDIVKIRNQVLELKQQGKAIIQLEGGEPFSPTPAFIKNAMKVALDADYTRYAPSSGIPQLLEAIRQKVSEKNLIPAELQHVIVTAGGMHGLFCSFQATLNEGDETIFFSPYWTPIKDLVRYAGGVPVRIPWTEVRTGDVGEALDRHCTERTKVIYVNSPSNPTGDVLSRQQLQAIARVAESRNLLVISDEAYEDVIYEREHVSIASLPGMFPRTISVFTLSKTYSMTGWRIGYVVADTSVMDVMRKLVLNSVNGVSTPTQHATAAAISDRSGYAGEQLAEFRLRRDLMCAGLQRAGFRLEPPDGAFYLLVDVRERLGMDSWKAMNTLLERTGIATVPGVVFGPEGEGHLRMSFSNPIDTLEKAVAALNRL